MGFDSVPRPLSGSSTLATNLGSRFRGGSWDITRHLSFPVISTTHGCDGDLWCRHEGAAYSDWSIMIWGLSFCGSCQAGNRLMGVTTRG
jgi:hypothetical protein